MRNIYSDIVVFYMWVELWVLVNYGHLGIEIYMGIGEYC